MVMCTDPLMFKPLNGWVNPNTSENEGNRCTRQTTANREKQYKSLGHSCNTVNQRANIRSLSFSHIGEATCVQLGHSIQWKHESVLSNTLTQNGHAQHHTPQQRRCMLCIKDPCVHCSARARKNSIGVKQETGPRVPLVSTGTQAW